MVDNWLVCEGVDHAGERYLSAFAECAAAERELERQRLRPGLTRSTAAGGLPVLDPEHEAAADRLNTAEAQLRAAYIHRGDG